MFWLGKCDATRIVVCFCLLIGSHAFAQQTSLSKKYGDQILSINLKDNLSIIASDALEGRKTGSRGQKMAAAFISAHFEEIGLHPPVNDSYYQTVPLFSLQAGKSMVSTKSASLENFKDFVYMGLGNIKANDAQVVFVGSGEGSDIEKIDLNGKVALVVGQKRANEIPIDQLINDGATLVLVCSSNSDLDFKAFAGRVKQSFSSDRLSLNKPKPIGYLESTLFVSPSVVEKILNEEFSDLQAMVTDPKKSGKIKRVKSGTINYALGNHVKQSNSENVLGYLEGSDKKDEVVVITAHYDHIGMKDQGTGDIINNGADDDGSGTVAVMELARVFAQAKSDGNGPRRSILFMTVTAEEIGLFGSEYYTENPIFPLGNTVVNLNIDMIGRTDPAHKDLPDYVYVIGSDKLSQELHQISEKTNATHTQLAFDYTYNDVNHPTNLYKRSDHWNFAKNNIPIVFYFDGIHEDYHLPSDEIDKIDFNLLTKRAKLIFHTAWELANRNDRIKND